MTGHSQDALIGAELGSIEERLLCAVDDLEAARGSLAWVEGVSGASIPSLPSSQELLDYGSRLRALAHRFILSRMPGLMSEAKLAGRRPECAER